MRLLILTLFLASFASASGFAKTQTQQKTLKELAPNQKSVTTSVRVFSQVISHQLPTDWKVDFRSAKDAHFMLEMVPQEQSVDNWTEMFTLQGFKGIAEKADPKAILAAVVKSNMQVCGKDVVFSLVDHPPVSGFPAQGAIIGCSKVPRDMSIGLKKGMGEVAYYVAVKGKKDIYLFHKAVRTKEFNVESSPITQENAQAFISDFMPIELIEP